MSVHPSSEHLLQEFFANPSAPLTSIKCSPYHAQKAVIFGDAAHSMVPFYGQGMNCVRACTVVVVKVGVTLIISPQGFEDCFVFHEMLDKHGDDLGAYSVDCHGRI